MNRKLFSKKKESKKEKIKLNNFIEKYKVANVLDRETNDKITDCILRGEQYIYISNNKVLELESKLIEQKKKDDNLTSTVSTNNDGIAQEKAGNIDLAIKIYEENIGRGSVATHSYERLMILYRKKNEFDNEIEVIEKAIQIFSEENERRYKKAISESKSENKKQEINKGFEECESVKGEDGWVIYNPYPVKKYTSRLQKVFALKEKITK